MGEEREAGARAMEHAASGMVPSQQKRDVARPEKRTSLTHLVPGRRAGRARVVVRWERDGVLLFLLTFFFYPHVQI